MLEVTSSLVSLRFMKTSIKILNYATILLINYKFRTMLMTMQMQKSRASSLRQFVQTVMYVWRSMRVIHKVALLITLQLAKP